eukprot:Opistho-1_new@66346
MPSFKRASAVRLCTRPLLLRLLFHGDLCADLVPVDRHPLRVLDELLVRLLAIKRAQIPLAERKDSVHMRLVLHGELESAVPVEQVDVHLDRAVRQPRLKEQRLGLRGLPAEQREFRRASLGCRKRLDVRNLLHLGDLVDGGVSDLRRVKFLAINGHCRKARPQNLVLDKAAQAHGVLPTAGVRVLVQNGRIRRHAGRDEGALRTTDGAVVAVEVDQRGALAKFASIALEARGRHNVPVDVRDLRVVPRRELAVQDAHEHVRRVVPRDAADHRPQLHERRLSAAHGRYVQVAVAIHNGRVALRGRAALVQRNFAYLERVAEGRLANFLASLHVKDVDGLLVGPVAHHERVVREGDRLLVEMLRADTRVLWGAHHAALVRVNLHASGRVHEEEVPHVLCVDT